MGNSDPVHMIDIHTIGAGGGSIAWIDKGGTGCSETGATKRIVGSSPSSSFRPRLNANSSSSRSVSNTYLESSIIIGLRLAGSHQRRLHADLFLANRTFERASQ